MTDSTVTATTVGGVASAVFTALPDVNTLVGADFSIKANTVTAAGLTAGTYPVIDFAKNTYYGSNLNTCATIKGLGPAASIFQMTPSTSTKGAYVAALAAGSTNQLALLRIGSASGNGGTGEVIGIESLTIQGTTQGHLYNGLMVVYAAPGSIVRNVKVVGIPGSSGAPPGETFPVNAYQCRGLVFDGCEVDGRLAGVPSSASLIGINSSTSTTITNANLHHSGYAFALATWLSSGMTVTGTTMADCPGVAVHIEQCSGTSVFDRCTFARVNSGGSLMYVGSQTASTVIQIKDPVFDTATFKVSVPGTYQPPGQGALPNAQLKTDITLTIAGVSRPDLLQFV